MAAEMPPPPLHRIGAPSRVQTGGEVEEGGWFVRMGMYSSQVEQARRTTQTMAWTRSHGPCQHGLHGISYMVSVDPIMDS